MLIEIKHSPTKKKFLFKFFFILSKRKKKNIEKRRVFQQNRILYKTASAPCTTSQHCDTIVQNVP